jgi:hypothetical protein
MPSRSQPELPLSPSPGWQKDCPEPGLGSCWAPAGPLLGGQPVPGPRPAAGAGRQQTLAGGWPRACAQGSGLHLLPCSSLNPVEASRVSESLATAPSSPKLPHDLRFPSVFPKQPEWASGMKPVSDVVPLYRRWWACQVGHPNQSDDKTCPSKLGHGPRAPLIAACTVQTKEPKGVTQRSLIWMGPLFSQMRSPGVGTTLGSPQ